MSFYAFAMIFLFFGPKWLNSAVCVISRRKVTRGRAQYSESPPRKISSKNLDYLKNRGSGRKTFLGPN